MYQKTKRLKSLLKQEGTSAFNSIYKELYVLVLLYRTAEVEVLKGLNTTKQKADVVVVENGTIIGAISTGSDFI